MNHHFRFDPINKDDLARWMSLSNGARIQTMHNSRRLVFGMIRGQLRRQYPDADIRDINLKLFEELKTRGKRRIPEF